MVLSDGVVLRFGGGVRHVGEQVSGDADAFSRSSHQVTQLSMQWRRLISSNGAVQINAVNLFNKYYYASCDQYGSCENGDAANDKRRRDFPLLTG